MSMHEKIVVKTENTQDVASTSDAIAELLLSQGIPLEEIQEEAFRRLFNRIGAVCDVPSVSDVESNPKRRKRCLIDLEHVSSLSVTVDIYGEENEERTMVLSAHYVSDSKRRENVVFFKRLGSEKLDPIQLSSMVMESLQSYEFLNIRISNIMFASTPIAKLFASDTFKTHRKNICFFYLLCKFLKEVIRNPEVIREFKKVDMYLDLAKDHMEKDKFDETFGEFQPGLIESSMKRGDTGPLRKWFDANKDTKSYPRWLDDRRNGWRETREKNGIVLETFEGCAQFSRELSTPHSTLSQVIPAIFAVKKILLAKSKKYSFAKNLDKFLTDTFIILRTDHYAFATMLDPRFAYSKEIHSTEDWSKYEGKLAKLLPRGKEELDFYRENLSNGTWQASPLDYWAQTEIQEKMPDLSKLAFEFLACPAVAINSNHYFHKSYGKFHRICGLYEDEELEDYLDAAGPLQEFHGKGATARTLQEILAIPYDTNVRKVIKRSALEQLFGPNAKKTLLEEPIDNSEVIREPSTCSSISSDSQSPAPQVEEKPGSVEFGQPEEKKPETLALEPSPPIKEEEPSEDYEEFVNEQSVNESKPAPMISNEEYPCEDDEAYSRTGQFYRELYSDMDVGNSGKVKEEADEGMIDEYEEDKEDEDQYSYQQFQNHGMRAESTSEKNRRMLYESFDNAYNNEKSVPSTSSGAPPDDSSQQVKPSARYCGQCRRNDKPMKIMQSKDELLWLLLKAVRLQDMSMEVAQKQFKRKWPWFCVEHTHETCQAIFDMLDIYRPEEVLSVPESSFKDKLLVLCTMISGGVFDISKDLLREQCFKFTTKYMQMECSFCLKILYRREMFSLAREAVHLTRWIDEKKLEVPDHWKHKGLCGKLLTNALKADLKGYVCLDHFPPNCMTKYRRHLMSVQKAFGSGNRS